MGLDYTLYLNIKDKESGVTHFRMEVAYWRKCWNISNELHNMCNEPQYSVPEKYRVQFNTMCSIIVLPDIIKRIKDELSNFNYNDNDFWNCQVWENAVVRDMSIRNMANLFALQAWLCDKEDDEILKYASYDGNRVEWLMEYLKEKDKCELFIESEFSY